MAKRYQRTQKSYQRTHHLGEIIRRTVKTILLSSSELHQDRRESDGVIFRRLQLINLKLKAKIYSGI